jgi:hypothetical protein
LHHGPIILGQIERRGDPARGDCRSEPVNRDPRQIDQRSVEKGGILALEEADAAEVVRYGDRSIRALLGKDRPRPLLAARVELREDRGDRDRPGPVLTDPPRGSTHAGLVERHDRPAVIVMPAFEHEHLAAHALGEILGPVAERWQRGARRQPDAHRIDARQIAPLHDGIDEMRRADHDAVDFAARDFGMAGEGCECRYDAGGDIRRRRSLDRVHDTPVFEQHRVCVGAADIDADPPHQSRSSKTERKSRS